ncbi:MAG: adenylate/guanylate cyclase domain-containing protein [Burkholderiales bacterium]
MSSPAEEEASSLRPWQRLDVQLATAFALLTLITAGLIGVLVHERQKHEIEDTVGTQLLNIARVGGLLVDPKLHAEVQRTRLRDSKAYASLRQTLNTMRNEVFLTTPVRTLANLDPAKRQARLIVDGDGEGNPGDPIALAPELVEPLTWLFEDGVARYTRVYRTATGAWISAFAPIMDAKGATAAVLAVDYSVDLYFDRLRDADRAILQASAAGTVAALVFGLLFARRLSQPIRALTQGAARVAAGDIAGEIPVRSKDEVGQLTHAFNNMLEGLRQRDFIRNAFGRYVSPEVARTLLESPEGLRLGGHKREVTVLMSDFRGYTRFAEQGDPALVMEVLNDYLGRMAGIIIEHGGTINEFIGDAIFAVFGAPLDHEDHAERAAAAALAMQNAMEQVNRDNTARGRPGFEMGIGVHTGDVVVGNIGSEQRTKYAVVGAAVNLAARVEGCTVGGQIFVTAKTLDRIRGFAEVAEPVFVELKGIEEPVALYELRAIRGRFAQRLAGSEDLLADLTLPLRGWVMEDKRVAGEIAGTVCRLGARILDARLDVECPVLANVKIRLRDPTSQQESGDIYGKVVAVTEESGRLVTRIRITSVDAASQNLIDSLLAQLAGKRLGSSHA